MTEPYLCQAIVRYGTGEDPPEYCEHEALERSDYCPEHDPDAAEDAIAEQAERARAAAAS